MWWKCVCFVLLLGKSCLNWDERWCIWSWIVLTKNHDHETSLVSEVEKMMGIVLGLQDDGEVFCCSMTWYTRNYCVCKQNFGHLEICCCGVIIRLRWWWCLVACFISMIVNCYEVDSANVDFSMSGYVDEIWMSLPYNSITGAWRNKF